MPKSIKKVGQKLFPEDADDISFLVDGDGGGVAFGESYSGFDFPKNLKDMTEEQKDKLQEEYADYMKSSASLGNAFDVVDHNPSEVLDPDSPNGKAKSIKSTNKPGSLYSSMPDPAEVESHLKQGGSFEWDSKNGFIVPDEEAAKARVLSANEARMLAEERRRSMLTSAQRDAEDRFSNL